MASLFRKTRFATSSKGNNDRRLLTVTIVKAEGIKAANKKSSDPYIVLCLKGIGDREIKSESFRSSHKSGTTNPVWEEKFVFGKTYDLSFKDNLPSLSVAMFHKGQFDFSESPLGKIYDIPLEDISTSETDKMFELKPDGRTTDVTGKIHIKLQFNNDPVDEEGDEENQSSSFQNDSEEKEKEKETPSPVAGSIEDLSKDNAPNCLHVKILRARKLLALDRDLLGRKTSSDPVVTMEVKGLKRQETAVVRKDLNPEWNEEFEFEPLQDPSLSLEVIVEDYNDITSRKILGKVMIPLYELTDKQRKQSWRKLMSETYLSDQDRGEIELAVEWKWSADIENIIRNQSAIKARKFSTQIANIGHYLTGDIESDPDDENTMTPDEEPEEKPPEKKTEEEQKADDEEKKQKLADLNDINIKSGDYQILVHVIEARDLKAENNDGTSDPLVYVECFGDKQHTKVMYQQTSCVFDELLIFNFREMDKEAFNEGFIRIAVRDSNSLVFAKNKMIGTYVIDCTQVYTMNKDHEMYRQWVPLMDDEDSDDTGVQGYLKISIQIVGPDDKVKVHDEASDISAEVAKEAAVGGDVGSLILSVPKIRKEWQFVVVSIYRCEGLPVMDGKIGVGSASIAAKTDAFCQLSFAGGKPIKTKVKTVKGESRLAMNPIFLYDLWYPVSIPTMTQLIKLSVYDHDPDKNELIGSVITKFNLIQQKSKAGSRSDKPEWFNIYGAPEFKTEKVLANIKKAGVSIYNAANQAFGHEIDWRQYYNDVPEKSSSYKGRAMLKFRIETMSPDNRPGRHKTPEVKAFRHKINPLNNKLEPSSRAYALQALVFCGNELPAFTEVSIKGAFTAGTTKQRLRVGISIGPIDLLTRDATYEAGGLCRWNEFLTSGSIKLPTKIDQIPDIFIYLIREDDKKAVCFKRIKAGDAMRGELIGFNRPTEWTLMEEDKVVNALNNGEFPGYILVKIGFGPFEDSRTVESDWKQELQKARELIPFQMRVHVYQAKDVPAADSNGLTDPFFKVNFFAQVHKTKVCNKTLFPAYYETLVFDNVVIPKADNFLYAPLVMLRLYDSDTAGTSEYLGTVGYPLVNAIVTEEVTDSLPEPDESCWFTLFKEKPGDCSCKVLLRVQLIASHGRTLSTVTTSIIPKTRNGIIELIAVGARDLAPFNYQPIRAPFLEIEVATFGSVYKTQTGICKKPNPANPNFLEKITMVVPLPENSIFAAPLQLRIRDSRLGGYLKPIVGVGTIDMTTKLPWSSNYKRPQTDVFVHDLSDLGASGASEFDVDAVDPLLLDALAVKVKKEADKAKVIVATDDFIATTQPPASIDEFILQRTAGEDTGAGVFGALNHIKIGKKKVLSREELAFGDINWDEDDSDAPPAWKVGRDVLESDLETNLRTTPFETYALTRGKVGGMLGNTLKVVGKFKGLVCVKESKDDPDVFPKEIVEQIMNPKAYKVRLYVLQGTNLARMDKDVFGKASSSDPYLKVNLGKYKFNDRKNAIDDVTEVDFYKLIEMDAELPGTSQLQVRVMDKNSIGRDALIGLTTIDLEDRLFDKRWQDWGKVNESLPGSNPDRPSDIRWRTKPIERRSLFQPGTTNSQGVLQCWVDIMKPEFANAFPCDDITLPPTQLFEMRVVIWKTKDVPPMDSLEKMSDLFVKCWPEGCKAQETDTHWRCKKGKASFNWRMLFDIELGHNTKLMKFPYFHIQLWDRDILKWNDCAGEGVLNLGKYFKKAYKKNVAIKLFESKQGAMAARAKKQAEIRKRSGLMDTNEDIPPEEKSEEVVNPLVKPEDSTEIDEVDDDPDDLGLGAIPNKQPKKDTQAAAPAPGEQAQAVSKPGKNATSWWPWSKKKKEGGGDGDDDDGADEPLINQEEQDAQEEKDEDDAEAKEMITTLKNMTGLWDIDPPDSSWLNLETSDHNTGKVTPMGKIAFSIQIWPKDKAAALPVGTARNDPNTNPYLAPPVGRLKFSWNPFVLGSELCGPALCAQFFCCLICITFIVLMIFCQPFLNIIINIIFITLQ